MKTKEDDNLSLSAKEAMVRIIKDKLEEFGKENSRIAKELLPGLMILEDLRRIVRPDCNSDALGLYHASGSAGKPGFGRTV